MKDTTDPPTRKRPSIRLNLDDWLPYLEDSEATEAEKVELIETLWNIAMAFVDLGWDLDSGEETSGQSLDLTAVLRAAVLNSEDNDKEEV